MIKCEKCNSDLNFDVKALNLKLLGRNVKTFLCLDCLAAHFKVDTEILKNKICEYKDMGCMLFKAH